MPGAYTVSMGWGLLRCSIASASRRYNSYIFQPFIGGLSISKAPLQASTSSSWARSGKVSRMPNRSSFQGPRLIFTLPARHCELNGPNRVALSPLSGLGVTLNPLSARTNEAPDFYRPAPGLGQTRCGPVPVRRPARRCWVFRRRPGSPAGATYRAASSRHSPRGRP